MKIALIDYGAGNTQSVLYAIERLGYSANLIKDPQELIAADGVILPGVGHAKSAMESLQSQALDEVIQELKQPVLGICLGMQLLADETEEGNCKGLGVVNEKVIEFNKDVKVPHMGWNEVTNLKGPLFNGIREKEYFYFVHSYFVPISELSIGTTTYGLDFSAAFQKNNFYACQFHPEKSGRAGELVLKNFIALCG